MIDKRIDFLGPQPARNRPKLGESPLSIQLFLREKKKIWSFAVRFFETNSALKMRFSFFVDLLGFLLICFPFCWSAWLSADLLGFLLICFPFCFICLAFCFICFAFCWSASISASSAQLFASSASFLLHLLGFLLHLLRFLLICSAFCWSASISASSAWLSADLLGFLLICSAFCFYAYFYGPVCSCICLISACSPSVYLLSCCRSIETARPICCNMQWRQSNWKEGKSAATVLVSYSFFFLLLLSGFLPSLKSRYNWYQNGKLSITSEFQPGKGDPVRLVKGSHGVS